MIARNFGDQHFTLAPLEHIQVTIRKNKCYIRNSHISATAPSAKLQALLHPRGIPVDKLAHPVFRDFGVRSGVIQRCVHADLVFLHDYKPGPYTEVVTEVILHALWDARADLSAWVQDGAVIYVCGDANAMAKDVHATLQKVLGEAKLDTLRREGRYLRDVY